MNGPTDETIRSIGLTRWRERAGTWDQRAEDDVVAAEEPLEIRVEGRGVAVMMRTPGHDRELGAGFLVTEGIIRSAADLFDISPCPGGEETNAGNILDVLLRDPDALQLERLTRHVFSASSCGLCGKTTIESVFCSFPPVGEDDGPVVAAACLRGLPGMLRQAQATFDRTGGLHASAIFTATGELERVREDVGRHNALDKVIGEALLEDRLPMSDRILLLSGRISFELMQKALAAGIPVVAGISAPSSLAVEFARGSGQTLVGFLRENGFNVYAGGHRIR